MLAEEKKEKIAYSIIKTLHSKFSDFPEDASNNRNAPFHEAFLHAFTSKFEGKVSNIPFFISLSSWFHGLNTTLGQSFFEKVSHILCEGIKKEFKNLRISHDQQTTISDIIANLKNGQQSPNLFKENQLIFEVKNQLDKDVANFTADCFFEDTDKIVAIELKTVKPNSGAFKNEKDKILSAKAGLKNSFQDKDIYFYLGFPFDPLSEKPTSYDKEKFMKYSVDFTKFFESDEILLADELWNFLSGDKNTMSQILSIINDIATPKFMEIYEFLNYKNNKQSHLESYINHLNKWHLFDEVILVKNENKIMKVIESNSRLSRIYNQPIFKKDGLYNVERKNSLLLAIK